MGFFKDLFTKKKFFPPADLSLLEVDIHSHFIPRIDDGSQSSKETFELLEAMKEFGYRKVITTPHVMMDYYKNTSDVILKGLDILKGKMVKAGVEMEIEAAAEYYCDDFLGDMIKKKDLLTFGDNYVLFELPFNTEPRMLNDYIFDMQMAGYKPVLAHPERYSYWYNEFDKFEAMASKGVLLQLNINSLSGHYPAETKKIAEQLVDKGLISLLGSDCHNMGHIDLMNVAIKEEAIHKVIASDRLLNNTL